MHVIDKIFIRVKAICLLAIVGGCMSLALSSGTAFAQEAPADSAVSEPAGNVTSGGEAEQEEKEPPIRQGEPYQPFDSSLFFTEVDIVRIKVALSGVTSDVVSEGEEGEEGAAPKPRRLKLSGIAWSGPNQWMIWLNGKRMTPRSLPPEVIDVNVHKDYIDLKWYDYGFRKIIKLRLRPNQVYDITTGVMLPG